VSSVFFSKAALFCDGVVRDGKKSGFVCDGAVRDVSVSPSSFSRPTTHNQTNPPPFPPYLTSGISFSRFFCCRWLCFFPSLPGLFFASSFPCLVSSRLVSSRLSSHLVSSRLVSSRLVSSLFSSRLISSGGGRKGEWL
jgi:hypothetical protein